MTTLRIKRTKRGYTTPVVNVTSGNHKGKPCKYIYFYKVAVELALIEPGYQAAFSVEAGQLSVTLAAPDTVLENSITFQVNSKWGNNVLILKSIQLAGQINDGLYLLGEGKMQQESIIHPLTPITQ